MEAIRVPEGLSADSRENTQKSYDSTQICVKIPQIPEIVSMEQDVHRSHMMVQ